MRGFGFFKISELVTNYPECGVVFLLRRGRKLESVELVSIFALAGDMGQLQASVQQMEHVMEWQGIDP